MIKLMIVDDQDLMLQGLSMMVGRDPDIEVVTTATNGKEALKKVKEKDLDLILMDIRMPLMDGVVATKKIKAYKEAIKIIILTTFNEDDYIFKSLKHGASGYLLKDASPDEIIAAIKTVYEGGTLINPEVATKVVQMMKEDYSQEEKEDKVALLTDREREICHHLADGYNNKEIGVACCISEGTVKNHLTKILDKLSLRDRTQLALFSHRNQL